MAVFRIEKTRDYTVMANHHLRNTALSLKAKGLLSLMLSLPEDWDYTTKGLARICRDGVDSICATVRELEDALDDLDDDLGIPHCVSQASNLHRGRRCFVPLHRASCRGPCRSSRPAGRHRTVPGAAG